MFLSIKFPVCANSYACEAENPFKPSFTERVSYKETPPEFMGDTVLLSVIGETDKTKVHNAAV